jgi:hypothetical protein
MRQGPGGSLEVIDDAHSFKFKPIPHLATINRPRAVGKSATLTFHRSRNRENCISNEPLAKLFLPRWRAWTSQLGPGLRNMQPVNRRRTLAQERRAILARLACDGMRV